MAGVLGTVVRGALSGARATVPMTMTFTVFERAGWFGRQPPRQVTERVLPRASEPAATLATTASHFGYGAAVGSAYAVLGRTAPNLVSTPKGAALGLLVAVASYELIFPLLRIRTPLHQDSWREITALLTGHLIYGGTLGRRLAKQLN